MVTLRKATRNDCGFIARMILTALHIDVEGNEQFVQHMKELVLDEGTLYHWSRCIIAEEDFPVGMILAYDGGDYHERRVRSFSFVCSDGRPVVDGDKTALLNQPDESGSGEYYIDSLAVIPDYRGKGIGRMLLTEAVSQGRLKGLTPSILVLPDNLPAVALYERVGFSGKEELSVFGDTYRKMYVVQKT